MSGKITDKILDLNLNFPGLENRFRIIIWISLTLVFGISVLDLSGWVFNIISFKQILPGFESMKIVTALSLVFVTVALSLIRSGRSRIYFKLIPRVLSLIVGLVAILTMSVYIYYFISGSESAVSEMKYIKYFVSHEFRMAFLTALNFLLTGCIIFLLSSNTKRTSGLAHALIIPVLSISYYVLLGYILGVKSASELDKIPVALNTSIAFCAISVSVLLMSPDTWLLKAFASGNTGAIIGRSLLTPLIILPVIIGWLRITGERKEIFNSEEGVLLVAVAYTVSFLTLVWLTANLINKIDIKRLKKEQDLRESEERFKAMAEASSVGMGVVSKADGTFLYVNPAYEKHFGYNDGELLRHKAPEIFISYNDRDKILNRLQENSGVSNFEVKLKKKDGTLFWTMSSVNPITFNGTPAYLGTFIDITKRKEAEEKLAYQASMLGAVTDAVIGSNLSLNITYWNKAAEKIYGWTSAEVMGKPSKEILRSEIKAEERQAILRTIAEGNAYHSEMIQFTKDNKRLIIEGFTIPLKDYEGNITSVVAINSDITEKKNAEISLRNSELRLKYHLENSPLAVVEWDKDFRIIQWSSEAERIFGLKKEEALGVPIDLLNLIFEEDYHIVEKTIERLTSGTELKVVSQNRNYTREREIIECVWYNSVLLDEYGKMSSVLSLIEDVTKLKMAEKFLKERTREIELANAQLTELNATKDKFFNIVAHDLKNPFTSLLGSSELLYANIDNMTKENVKKLAVILNDSAKGGFSILQNLLDWSRSQTGQLKISPETVNLKTIINENIETLSLPSSSKEISLTSELVKDLFIITDRNMLNTVLRNLLSNAVKFTHRYGKVTVSIRLTMQEVIISVSDTGIGISHDKIGELFRIDNKHTLPGTENEQGTGLGLKLSREFVEKLGGTIAVESKVGKGSTFSFSVPLKS